MTTTRAAMADELDFDYVVVGSGFGGSVAALRLREKGYRVCVIEKDAAFAPRTSPRATGICVGTCGSPGSG